MFFMSGMARWLAPIFLCVSKENSAQGKSHEMQCVISIGDFPLYVTLCECFFKP